MEPLISNGVDPALLRIVDKRGQERDSQLRRKRGTAAEPPGVSKEAEEQEEEQEKEEEEDRDRESENEAASDSPKHELDDLA